MTEAMLDSGELSRPLAAGLELVAANPTPPGLAYTQLMEWAGENGHFGFDDMWRDWIPQFKDAYYVSTTITSGGFARDTELPFAEAIAQNTALAGALTNAIIANCAVRPSSVILASDLPKVPGWKQSDYLIFWLSLLEGVPGEVSEGLGAYMQEFAGTTKMDDSTASYDDKLRSYEALVEEFVRMGNALAIPGRNDYMRQRPRIFNMIQLIDTEESLGCRAERLYARLRGLNVYKIRLEPDLLSQETRRALGAVTALGAKVGIQDRSPVRLIPQAHA